MRRSKRTEVGTGTPETETQPRQRFELDDRGFDEVPEKYRKFFRRWEGPGDVLGPNEMLCPVCKVVIRAPYELRPGDRLYCMACLVRLQVARGSRAALEARVEY